GGPILRNLTRVDFIAEVTVNNPTCPGGRPERDFVGTTACNSSNQPVGLAEIESRIEAKCHDGGGGMGGARASEDCHLTFPVHASGVVGGRQRIDLIKMVAFHPELELAG